MELRRIIKEDGEGRAREEEAAETTITTVGTTT